MVATAAVKLIADPVSALVAGTIAVSVLAVAVPLLGLITREDWNDAKAGLVQLRHRMAR